MKKQLIQKLYCYVDETGQDTKGQLFIVSMVVSGQVIDRVRHIIEMIEKSSGKHVKKWQKTRNKERLSYIEQIFTDKFLKNNLRFLFSHLSHTGTDYVTLTIYALANILTTLVFRDRSIILTIDALTEKQQRLLGKKLKQFGISIESVKGGRDQSDPLLRLADALAGFVRDGREGHPTVKKQFQRLFENKLIKEVR